MKKTPGSHWGYGTPPLEENDIEGVDSSQKSFSASSMFDDSSQTEYDGSHIQQSLRRNLRARGSTKKANIGDDDDDYVWSQDDLREPAEPKKRKSANARRKRRELQFPDLVAPLSVWAQQAGVEPKDIESFATRDIKKRIAQAEKNGYIKRNLNVFFLYKRAFRDVAQAWMEIHHPELSKTQPPLVTLVGESWSKESEEFKKSYTFYSDLEREGLRRAFPNYKYRPGTKKEQQPVGGSSAKPADDQDYEGIHSRHSSESSNGFGSDDRLRHQSPSGGPYGSFGSPQPRLNQHPYNNRVLLGRGDSYSGQAYFHHGTVTPPMRYISPSPSGMGEPVPLPQGPENSFLHPQRAEFPSFANGRMRSESPALSHHSHQPLDGLPIDPSLSGSYSDYFPSRAGSEEPSCIIPSQMYNHDQPALAHSHPWSTSGSFTDDPFGLPPNMAPSMLGSRCASEEPWQGAADSVLSSVPIGGIDLSQINGENNVDWHIDATAHSEPVQQSNHWDMHAWAFDFDGALDAEG